MWWGSSVEINLDPSVLMDFTVAYASDSTWTIYTGNLVGNFTSPLI